MFRGGIGWPEILLILAVVVLLFGANKLPDLARGSGRALRIFKAETKGLIGDDDGKDEGHVKNQDTTTEAQREIDARAAESEARTQAESPRRETTD